MKALRLLLMLGMMFTPAFGIACTIPGLDYHAVFEAGRSELSAREVLRLANWKVQLGISMPGGGTYGFNVLRNSAEGVSPALANQRARYLRRLLVNLGVDPGKIDKPMFGNYVVNASASNHQQRINTVLMGMEPRCPPHGCCAYY